MTPAKKIMTNTVFGLLATLLFAGTVHAHGLWVSLYESRTHAPGHIVSAVGWGHTLPMDDFTSSPNGSVSLKEYLLVGPDGKRIDLGLPNPKPSSADHAPLAEVVTGDMGIRKINILKDSPEGTYQVAIIGNPGYFTRYIDSKGKMKMAPRPLDQIKDVKNVIESFRYSMSAKSYYTVGKWTEPAPLGTELEIMPMTDLSQVKPGDTVEFQINFMGRPVSTDSNSINMVTLVSDTFGNPNGYSLSAYVKQGKVSFIIPTAGHWVANIMLPHTVTPDGPLKKYAKQCKRLFITNSVSFTVNP